MTKKKEEEQTQILAPVVAIRLTAPQVSSILNENQEVKMELTHRAIASVSQDFMRRAKNVTFEEIRRDLINTVFNSSAWSKKVNPEYQKLLVDAIAEDIKKTAPEKLRVAVEEIMNNGSVEAAMINRISKRVETNVRQSLSKQIEEIVEPIVKDEVKRAVKRVFASLVGNVST